MKDVVYTVLIGAALLGHVNIWQQFGAAKQTWDLTRAETKTNYRVILTEIRRVQDRSDLQDGELAQQLDEIKQVLDYAIQENQSR